MTIDAAGRSSAPRRAILRPERDLAAAGLVAVDDAVAAADDAAGREVGAGDDLQQLVQRDTRACRSP